MNYSNDSSLLNDDYDAMINNASIELLAATLSRSGYVCVYRRDLADFWDAMLMGAEMAKE